MLSVQVRPLNSGLSIVITLHSFCYKTLNSEFSSINLSSCNSRGPFWILNSRFSSSHLQTLWKTDRNSELWILTAFLDHRGRLRILNFEFSLLNSRFVQGPSWLWILYFRRSPRAQAADLWFWILISCSPTIALILRKCRRRLQIYERAKTRLLILILARLGRKLQRGDEPRVCRVITKNSEFWTYKL